jgi:hypothetical protein
VKYIIINIEGDKDNIQVMFVSMIVKYIAMILTFISV